MNLVNFWFVLIAVLWGGYFVLEGFDFGVGMLLPFLPRDERERGAMLETIGPVWDGNEVWLVVPAPRPSRLSCLVRAMFSGFYLALLLLLFFLIIRVVSFEWRGREPRLAPRLDVGERKRQRGDRADLGHRALEPPAGVSLDSSGDYAGGFWNLFTAAILGGIAFVLVFAFHGAIYLTLRTVGDLCERSRRAARMLAIPAPP
jgi:cytochrome d ubiquinol oxidase subunit II